MGLARWTEQLPVYQDFDGIQIVVVAVLTAVAAVAGAVPITVETGFASNMSILLRAVIFMLAAASVVVGAVGIPAAAAIGEVAIVVAVVAVVGAAAIGEVIFVAVVAVVGAVAAAGAVAPAAVTAVAAVDILVSAAVNDVVAAIESRKII
jgi:hypothetical protein